MRRTWLLAAVALGAVLGAAGDGAAEAPPPGKPPQVSPAAVAAAQRDFLAVARVLQSPRCMNCHPKGDAPLQSDKGVPHAMRISRKSNDAGLMCTACHRAANNAKRGAPPGAVGWHMPSASVPMVFEGRTPAELCAQLKNPAETGGRALAALLDHLEHDPLVLWGWSPGPGRTLPPMTHAEMVAHAKAWVAAGAPCPP